MDLEHWALLILSVFPWLVSLFFVVVLWAALPFAPSTPGEFVLLLAIAIGATVVGFGGSFALSWWCVHPPRWRRWVRMHRFAEVNGLEFVRVEEDIALPGSLVRPGPMRPRIFDSFVDPRTGLRLGNWVRPTATGRGLADWRAYIVIPAHGVEADDDRARHLVRRAATLAGVDWGLDFTAEVADGVLVAVRFPSVRMRRTATIRAMFALADGFARALEDDDAGPDAPSVPWAVGRS